MSDCSWESHEFHFATRLPGDIPAIDAFDLMAKRIARIRRALSVSHRSEEPRHGLQIAGQKVGGQITCDPDDDAVGPPVVIDGREIFWKEFGRMPGTFEGFHFRLEIVDRSEAP